MAFLKRLVMFAIVVAVVGVGWTVLAGQGKTAGARADVVIKDQKQIYERLEALEPNFYLDNYDISHVYGTVKNKSQQECAYVKFEIKVRNKDRKLLKTLDVTVKDIGPGEVKTYDVNSGSGIEGLELETKITEAGFRKR